jgi:N,N-dimethylformamidase beta subunit-like protein/uncharacterized protein DUF4082/Big-like domain-containing protein
MTLLGRPSLRLLPVGLAVAAVLLSFGGSIARADTCTGTAVYCENLKPGNPPSQWDIIGAGDPSIQGFATDISVNRGDTVQFKVKTNAQAYHLDIYRLGYYGGSGARLITTVTPSAQLPQTQPACLSDPTTGLVDCGNWAVSAQWNVPADAVSGIYIAKLVRDDTGGASHMVFIVRDDGGHSDLLFQTSDTTWQAYNEYGGNSLYKGSPASRAYKVSYNRPFTTRQYASPSWLFEDEYPMVRWLERNGYDVSYTTGVDTARRGPELLEHKVFMSVGHDEYWSGEQRANVEAARAAGVNLAFLSGNEVFWKTRWEPSTDSSATPYRTLVCYKETAAGAKIDPTPTWTGTWRDGRLSPPSDGGRPENALTGTLSTVNAYRQDPMTVSASEGDLRFWRNTSVANLAPGATATIAAGILGHEWDEDVDNGFRPAGLFDLSSSTISVDKHLIDQGNTYVPGTATHHLTLYRAASGALVFSAGTAQWSWLLDNQHTVFSGTAPAPDTRIQQATVNQLADMGVQPGSLDPALVPATASTDTTAPTSQITSPAAGTVVPSGSTVTITGTASDVGAGIVAGVAVSVDGGATWHRATGRNTWSYQWTAGGFGSVTVLSRAVDDSGNLEPSGSSSVSIVVGCPCSLWNDATRPAVASSADSQSVELGVRFRPDRDGFVTGLRYYRGPSNPGPHVGSLWSASGSLLARATFTGETATGWQQVSFSQPVAVTANTTYVASYHAPSGGYALDLLYFNTAAFTNGPLTALQSNGVYVYGTTPLFPTNTYSASNYWVDVVFNTTAGPDTTPPTVASTSPAAGATGVDPGGDVRATFSEPVDPATLTGNVELRNGAGTLVPASVQYDAPSSTVTLHPTSALANSTSYTATVKGGASGVKDLAGNALGADVSWSFTTASQSGGCPCSIWPASARPAVAAVGGTQSVELGTKFRADVSGYVTGIRFYKGATNTGTHIGSLWTSTGTRLAQVTFSNETASGWQQANFATPVAIAAGTTYVVSYFAPNGAYSVDLNYFASAAQVNAPLRALQNGTDGGNGVYRYGSQSGFPSDTYSSSNYWVDVVFSTTAP